MEKLKREYSKLAEAVVAFLGDTPLELPETPINEWDVFDLLNQVANLRAKKTINCPRCELKLWITHDGYEHEVLGHSPALKQCICPERGANHPDCPVHQEPHFTDRDREIRELIKENCTFCDDDTLCDTCIMAEIYIKVGGMDAWLEHGNFPDLESHYKKSKEKARREKMARVEKRRARMLARDATIPVDEPRFKIDSVGETGPHDLPLHVVLCCTCHNYNSDNDTCDVYGREHSYPTDFCNGYGEKEGK